MTVLHSRILKECNQIPWAGHYDENSIEEDDCSLPYSKNILFYRIMHKDVAWNGKQKTGSFVGPTTFQRFMHCFRYVFNAKNVEISEKMTKRRYEGLFFLSPFGAVLFIFRIVSQNFNFG